MDPELLNILRSREVPIDDQRIIDYLKNELQGDARQQLEQQEMDDAMMQDAMEGLNSIADKTRLELMARELNQHMQQRLADQQKKHREKRKWKDQSWILITIVTVLLLITIGYIVVKMMRP